MQLKPLLSGLSLLSLASAIPTPDREPERGGGIGGIIGGDPITGDKPDPDKVYIESVTYAGSGCPGGSVASTFSSDRTVFTLSMDNYVAQTGKGIAPAEATKNCLITAKVHYPAGFSLSIFRAQYQGYANIPVGMTGYQTSTYSFAATGERCQSTSKFPGKYLGDYLVADEIPQAVTIRSPCGANQVIMKINSRVFLDPVTGDDNQQAAVLTTDSIDGSFKHKIGFQWEKCPQKP